MDWKIRPSHWFVPTLLASVKLVCLQSLLQRDAQLRILVVQFQSDRPCAYTPLSNSLHSPYAGPLPVNQSFQVPCLSSQSPPLQLSQYLITSLPSGSVGDLSAGVCKFQDATDDPTLLSRGREGVGGYDFEMAAECRAFAHSVSGGS